ncbi:MAG: hypothetical protein GY913_26050 [Proteobacteria bacterium]|nr:hypothetical protein [Pseudomonadota bacterium]MCP4920379.1 hypothetical protein [Pseudomonadota bacterium]
MPALTAIGVVDVGSNSLHLQVVADGETIATGRSAVRLGEFEHGALRTSAIEGCLEALSAFRDQAMDLGCVAFRASGTASLRDASNAAVLLERARDELGLELRVLSGEDEARLAWRGARHGLGFEHGLVFDLGGRSTEIAVGRTSPDYAVSLPLGHQSATALGSRSDVEARMASLLAPLDVPSAPLAAGCAGTALTLGQMAAASREEPWDDRHGLSVSRDELAGLVAALTTRDPMSLPGVDARRVRTLPMGAVAVLALLDGLGLPGFTTSQSALREGLVQELAECSLP